MNILVTGNAGFIGSHMVDYLLDLGHVVVGVDGMYEGSNRENVNPGIEFYTLPLHEDRWMEIGNLIYNTDYIIHFAAFSNVDTSIKTPLLFNLNYLATANVLEFARKHKIPVIQISTDETYGSWSPPAYAVLEIWGTCGNESEGGYNESQILNPSSAYAASKASCDLLALSYYKTFGVDVRVTRCSNNFGTRQVDKLIPTIFKKAKAGEKIPIFKTFATRDWLHVKDHCEAIWTVVNKGYPGEIYNISANEEKTPQQVVELLGFGDLIESVEDRPGYDTRYFCNSSKIRELGWKPSRTLESSVNELKAFYML